MYVYIFGMEFCYIVETSRVQTEPQRVICPAPESERCFRLLSDSAVARYDCSFNQRSTDPRSLVFLETGVAIYAQHDRDNRIDCLQNNVDGKWEKLIRFEIGRLAERIAAQRGEKKKSRTCSWLLPVPRVPIDS